MLLFSWAIAARDVIPAPKLHTVVGPDELRSTFHVQDLRNISLLQNALQMSSAAVKGSEGMSL